MDRAKALEGLSRLKGLTPEECATVILSGVRRNQGLIVVTKGAKIMWLVQRLSPRLVAFLMARHHRRSRAQVHLED